MSYKGTHKPGSRLQRKFDGPSMTKQADAEDADVNKLAEKFGVQRLFQSSMGATRKPFFFQGTADDFQSMVNKVQDARNQFGTLGAGVRRRFFNDPYQLLRFLDNPENRDEAVKLGLVKAQPKPVAAGQEKLPLPPAQEEDLPEEALKADEEANPRPKARSRPRNS